MVVRVAAFVYDFSHQKSTIGLPILSILGPCDTLVLGAPFVSLDTTAGPPTEGITPEVVALSLGYRYKTCGHDSAEARRLLRAHGTELAVVLGARVLSDATLEAVGGPTINIHPGVLPDNRGLDAAAWAIQHRLPQGVTAHVVTPRIDGGPIIAMSLMPTTVINGSGDLAALRDRLRWKEFELLERVLLDYSQFGLHGIQPQEQTLGIYHTRMSTAEASAVEADMNSYQSAYAEISGQWHRLHHNWIDEIPFHPW